MVIEIGRFGIMKKLLFLFVLFASVGASAARIKTASAGKASVPAVDVEATTARIEAMAARKNAAADDPFDLPKGTTVINRDDSGDTWAFNGFLKRSMHDTKKLLKDAILKKGFTFKYEIPIDEKGEKQVLLAFEKGRETLLLMVWNLDGWETYFSYGITK